MSLDMTTFDQGLKVHYTDEEVQRLTLTDHPFLALLARDEKFLGKNLPIPIIYGNTQNRSATFSVANAGTSTTLIKDFVLTRVRDYAVAKVDGETMDASESDADAFMEAAIVEVDGAFESMASSLATALFRNGTGSIGTVGSIGGAGNTVLTLSDITTAVFFEVGMTLVESATDGGSLGGGSSTGEVIFAMDRDAGTLTSTSASWTTVLSNLTTGHFLYVLGDLNAKVSGLDAWIPSTAPSNTTFFSVDRSKDPVRLGGSRYDGSNQPIEQALVNGAVRAAKWGGRVSHYFVSYEQYANCEHALGAKRVYVDVRATEDIGFQGLEIIGPKGPIKIVPDAMCQATVAWGLDMRRWKLYSLQSAIRILRRSGGDSVRDPSNDAEQTRIGGYFQLGCRAPGHNVRVALQS